jgi:hypothetical protein
MSAILWLEDWMQLTNGRIRWFFLWTRFKRPFILMGGATVGFCYDQVLRSDLLSESVVFDLVLRESSLMYSNIFPILVLASGLVLYPIVWITSSQLTTKSSSLL